jgi:hypothetical protein
MSSRCQRADPAPHGKYSPRSRPSGNRTAPSPFEHAKPRAVVIHRPIDQHARRLLDPATGSAERFSSIGRRVECRELAVASARRRRRSPWRAGVEPRLAQGDGIGRTAESPTGRSPGQSSQCGFLTGTSPYSIAMLAPGDATRRSRITLAPFPAA